MLAKQSETNKMLACNIESIPAIELFEADTSQSLMFQEETPRKGQEINRSPIKMIDEFEEKD